MGSGANTAQPSKVTPTTARNIRSHDAAFCFMTGEASSTREGFEHSADSTGTRSHAAGFTCQERETLEVATCVEKAAAANNLEVAARRECDGWLTQARFDCTMRATSAQDWAKCPP